jgi:hypothetical protein
MNWRRRRGPMRITWRVQEETVKTNGYTHQLVSWKDQHSGKRSRYPSKDNQVIRTWRLSNGRLNQVALARNSLPGTPLMRYHHRQSDTEPILPHLCPLGQPSLQRRSAPDRRLGARSTSGPWMPNVRPEGRLVRPGRERPTGHPDGRGLEPPGAVSLSQSGIGQRASAEARENTRRSPLMSNSYDRGE